MKRESRRVWPDPRPVIKAVLKAAIIPILDPVLGVMQTAWDLCCGKRRKPVPRTRDVLLARVDGLGDFIVGLDATRRLADHYRAEGRRVTLLVKSTWAELADSTGVADRILPLDFPRYGVDLRYRSRVNQLLRRRGFDIAVYLPLSRELVFGDALMRATMARQRIGSTGNLDNCTRLERAIGDRWYTKLVPAQPRSIHELERNIEFLRGFGIFMPSALPVLRVPAPTWPSPDGDYYVLCPSAGEDCKRWPVASFAKVAECIANGTGWRGVIVGGTADGGIAVALQKACSVPLASMAGPAAPGLAELVRLLSLARLVVANDTGTAHIAAALGRPTVVILGGGHFGRFFPYPQNVASDCLRVVWHEMPCFGCNWRCTLPHPKGKEVPCITNISVAAVWKEVEHLLSRTQRGAMRDVS